MYNSVDIANRIKNTAKVKNVSIKNLLEECNLNKNTLNVMVSRGTMPGSEVLAKIADYLEVSTDYLLGRSDYYASPFPKDYNKLTPAQKEEIERLIELFVSKS